MARAASRRSALLHVALALLVLLPCITAESFVNLYLYGEAQCLNTAGAAYSPAGCSVFRDSAGAPFYGYFDCTQRDTVPYYSCPDPDCAGNCTLLAGYGGDNCDVFPLIPGLYARAICSPSAPELASPAIEFYSNTNNCTGDVYLAATPTATGCLFGDQYACNFETNLVNITECQDPLCESTCGVLSDAPVQEATCYGGKKIICTSGHGDEDIGWTLGPWRPFLNSLGSFLFILWVIYAMRSL